MRASRDLTGRRRGVNPGSSDRRDGGAARSALAGVGARRLTHGRRAAVCAVSRAGRRRVAMLWSLALLAFPATLAPLATAARTTRTRAAYALSVLPTLECPRHFACANGRFDLSDAAGINNKGWIVGDSNVPGSTSISNATEHAALWRHGHITDLGGLGGPNSAIGFVARPSDTGQLAGNVQNQTVDPLGEGWSQFGCDTVGDPCAGDQYEIRGFVWRAGRMRPLPTLGGNNAIAGGGENARGQITGLAETAVRDPTCSAPQVLEWKPVIWGPKYGQIHTLPLYPGDNAGGAAAINDKGQVVGASGSCASPVTPSTLAHALLWQPDGAIVNLGTLGGRENNVALAINNRGQVVGWSDLPGDTSTHAFLWQHGHMTDLGTLPDDVSSSAWGINDRGQVVGQSCDQQGNCRAVLWQNGTITDLNAITHKPTSFELLGAEAINDQGVIVGPVYDPARGTSYAYAATPCGDRTAANQHCAHSGPLTTRNAAAKATLPAAIRAQLQRRKRFGPFGGL